MRNEASPESVRPVIRPVVHADGHPGSSEVRSSMRMDTLEAPRSGRPCGWTPWKLRGCRLHTIPLLSLTLELFAHQEWEGNKPGMK
jgi:hypothetical protein